MALRPQLERINSENSGLTCIGWYEPGFDSVEEMSTNAILIRLIPATRILAVALGAKGQAWLLKNHGLLAHSGPGSSWSDN